MRLTEASESICNTHTHTHLQKFSLFQTGFYQHEFHAVDVQAPIGAADLTRHIPKGSSL